MKGDVNFQRRAPDSERLGGELPDAYRNLIGWSAFGISGTTTIKPNGGDTPIPFSVDRGGTLGISVNAVSYTHLRNFTNCGPAHCRER